MYSVKESRTENGISYVHAEGIPRLNIFKTFDCGQCFRFEPACLFGNKYEYGGVAFGKYVVFGQNNDTEIFVYGSTKQEFESIWAPYLSLDVDYEDIDKNVSQIMHSAHMDKCIEYSKGIRLLRQDKWEALCSFIISQNNNIPRIKKIITEMSKKYGDVSYFDGKEYYSFPSAQALFKAGADALFELKTGFRARYIFDASSKVANGEIDLDAVYKMDFDSALCELYKIKGVGLKVASCALLFGFDKGEAFPIDVWMKRAIDTHFNGHIDIKALNNRAGVAQQYLFYYEKYNQSLD